MREIADIHLPFIAWLDKLGIPYHRNRPDKRTTATAGDPDFLVTWMSHCVYIECKVPGNHASVAQQARVVYLRKAGNKVVIAYSLEMCIEACKDILCVGNTLPAESASSSGGEKQAEVDCVITPTPPASLWIGKLGGVDYVFSGDSTPGGICEKVRRATPADIINIH
jgi:hypothetical protein